MFAGSRPNRWYTGSVVSAMCCLCLVTAACTAKNEKQHASRSPVLITTAEAISRDTPNQEEGIGWVRALKSVAVKARVTGLLSETHFKAGDYVKKGQLLFSIDPAPFQAKLKESESKVLGCGAELEQANRDLKRFERLFGEKSISAEQLEQKQLDVKSKSFVVRLHEAEREAAELNLSYCSVLSPLDGQTGDIHVDEGNTISAYQDALVTIKQIKPIRVEFSLPGKFLHPIRQASKSNPLEVTLLAPGADSPVKGHLSLIDNVINRKTGMIMLEGTLPNEDVRLWPGQFVNVRLTLGVTGNAVLIPSRAVTEGVQGSSVWVVKPDSTVVPRTVTVARRIEDMEVISSGLIAGERVVVEGQMALFSGAKVAQRDTVKATQTPDTDPSTHKGGQQ